MIAIFSHPRFSYLIKMKKQILKLPYSIGVVYFYEVCKKYTRFVDRLTSISVSKDMKKNKPRERLSEIAF